MAISQFGVNGVPMTLDRALAEVSAALRRGQLGAEQVSGQGSALEARVMPLGESVRVREVALQLVLAHVGRPMTVAAFDEALSMARKVEAFLLGVCEAPERGAPLSD